MLRSLALLTLVAVACAGKEPAKPTPSAAAPTASPIDATASPFERLALRVGMAREEAEQTIANVLGRPSTYSPYGNNLRGGTVVYTDATGAFALEVVYNPGAPAPWVMRPDGVAEHHPPVDESIASFRTLRR